MVKLEATMARRSVTGWRRRDGSMPWEKVDKHEFIEVVEGGRERRLDDCPADGF